MPLAYPGTIKGSHRNFFGVLRFRGRDGTSPNRRCNFYRIQGIFSYIDCAVTINYNRSSESPRQEGSYLCSPECFEIVKEMVSENCENEVAGSATQKTRTHVGGFSMLAVIFAAKVSKVVKIRGGWPPQAWFEPNVA